MCARFAPAKPGGARRRPLAHPEGDWQQGWLDIRDGRIAAVGTATPESGSPESGVPGPGLPGPTLAGARWLSARGQRVAPGLIDIHIHGTDGFDALGDVDQQLGMADALPRYGVTAYVAAVVSGATARMEEAVRAIAAAPPIPSTATTR
ncbi:MAG: hypothetical protein ACYC5Y_06740 [Symbiobacteriia bacterium]